MSDLKSIIKDIVAGNSFKIIREIRNLPLGDSLAMVWFTVKTRREDTDANAVIQKVMTTIETDDGQILDDGTADRISLVSVKLKPTDTIKLKQNSMYWYDVKLMTTAGSQYTPELGQIIVVDPVTQSGLGSITVVIGSGMLGVSEEGTSFIIGIVV